MRSWLQAQHLSHQQLDRPTCSLNPPLSLSTDGTGHTYPRAWLPGINAIVRATARARHTAVRSRCNGRYRRDPSWRVKVSEAESPNSTRLQVGAQRMLEASPLHIADSLSAKGAEKPSISRLLENSEGCNILSTMSGTKQAQLT